MPVDTFSTLAGNDGTGFYQHTAWPPNPGTWFGDAATELWVAKSLAATIYSADITCLRWDTSSIPDNATITAALVQLYTISKVDSDNYSIVGDYYDFGGEPTVAGDWIETASPSIFSAADLSSVPTGVVNEVELTDLSGISKTGITGIRLTLSTGTPVIGENNILFADAEDTVNQEPRLVVTYSVPPSLLVVQSNLRW